MEHVPKFCNVSRCKTEASYWIDTSEGFVEALLSKGTDETFYLCVDHKCGIENSETGNYSHLRIDTGKIIEVEIGGYCCHKECDVCNS
jgi:hypothetical protein